MATPKYYYECGHCRGTVIVQGDGKLNPLQAPGGAVAGAALLGIPTLGCLAIPGAILGAALGMGGKQFDHDSKCIDCGAVYDWQNVQLLREKAMPTPGSTSESLSGLTNAPRAAEAYCVRCKSKRVMKEATQITMKDGRPATGGKCPVCGTTMFKIEATS